MKNLIRVLSIIVLSLSLYGCGVQWQYSTLNTAGYVDTLRSEGYAVEEINTVSQLRWKLRTDFNFRWDFAQYAMNQPYSWYFNNFRYNYWRPYNSFDMYWNSYSYWTDWA